MRIAVLDIETTGINPNQGTIIEVGICLLDLETGFISQLLDTTVREKHFETQYGGESLKTCWVFQNTDLTVETIRNGPAWEDVVGKIQTILNKFPITAFNKVFDLGFFKDRGLLIPHELPCPMIQATPVLKLPSEYKKKKWKWPKVQEAWDHFFPDQNTYKEIHRAYDDAMHEAEIILALYKIGAWKPEK
jgi:DNA polymerase-3 subunit epsilon